MSAYESDSDSDGDSGGVSLFGASLHGQLSPPNCLSPTQRKHSYTLSLSGSTYASSTFNLSTHLDRTHLTSTSANHLLSMHPLQLDKIWMETCTRRARNNPFPGGLSLNSGWNRERAENELHFKEFQGSPDQRMDVNEQFASFNWARQRRRKGVDKREFFEEGELRGMFRKVFRGRKTGEWKREPGSWWAQRKHVFGRDRGRSLVIKPELEDDKIGPLDVEVVEAPRVYVGGPTSQLKRKLGQTNFQQRRDTRNTKPFRYSQKAEEVMSNEWRARRRMQEKKAGRWTDGTLRQMGIWEAFSWVLDVDDPRKNIWVASDAKREGSADPLSASDAGEVVEGDIFAKFHLSPHMD